MSETEAKTAGHQAFLDRREERVTALRDELARMFPDPVEIVLELGCGHGHYLTAYAEANPRVPCLGLDLVTKRISKANAKKDKRGLDQLTFLKAEAREFMMALPAHIRLERCFILFPDPWPKKRHSKNRLIQNQLLDSLGEHSRNGTLLHLRTDDENHFAWGMETIASHPAWEIDDEQEWPFENPSFFQDLFSSHQSLTAVFRA